MDGKEIKSGMTMLEVEEFILNADQVEIPVTHSFTDGMYMREITVPAGAFIVGHKHTHSCFNILSKGRMLLKKTIDDPGTLIEAPCSFVTDPGVQKMAVCIDECVYANIFRTDETDIEKLEELLVEKSAVVLAHEEKMKKLKEGGEKWLS